MSAPPDTPSFWSLFARGDEPEREPSLFWSLFTDPASTPDGEPPRRENEAPSALSFDENLMFWAMRNLPVEEAVKHLAAVGCIGSGKTTLIQLFLQSLAPRFRAGWKYPEQLIIFDGKCDAIPMLASLGLYPEDENVYILNPHDERGAVWDVAEGARTPLMARYFATLLVPPEPGSKAPYFPDSARDLVYAVLLGLNASGNRHWTFRDLICALDSKERIQAVTARHPRAQVIAQRVFGDEHHSFGVLSTLGTKMVRFEQVAALWHSYPKPRPFSVQEFLKRPGVLVLGNDPVLHDSLWPVNALLLKALTEEILRRPNTNRPRHWFVLDEFPAMDKVECIHDLLRRGRSKGASVLIGTQGLEALVEVYQENAADDILSQCTYKTFLRAGGPKTAEWAERFFHKIRRIETTYSESWGKEGHGRSAQYKLEERFLFLASVFLNLPLPARGGPLIAISDVPCLQTTLISRRWFDQLLSWLRPLSTIPAVLPRPNIKDQTLKPWEPEEERSFTGEPQEQAPPAGKQQDGDRSSPGKTSRKPKLIDRKKRRRKPASGRSADSPDNPGETN
jgi:hypothetical protein